MEVSKESDSISNYVNELRDSGNNIEKYLQKNSTKIAYMAKEVRESNLLNLMRAFMKRGGNVLLAPSENSRNVWNWSVEIKNNDVVIPVCHVGKNRSQIMHAVLCAIKRASGKNILVTKPHGAESGWDPHSGYENLNNNNFFEWLLDPEVTTDILAKAHRDVLEEPKSVRMVSLKKVII
jgi:hypothetical protein